MRKPKNIFVLICAAILATACGGSTNQNAARGNSAAANTNSAGNSTPAQAPQTPLETELARLQRANFRQVIAFSRTDGGKLTAEDIEYFREWAPTEQINQRLKTDDDKYIVAGTNFVFTPEQINALKSRFAVEDFTEKYGRRPASAPTPKQEN